MGKNLKLFTDDTSRQTYEQSQEYLEPYVGGVSSAQTSSYNTRNIGKYFIDYTRTEHRLSDFGINNKDIIEVEYLESPGGIGAINIDFIPTGQDIRVQGKFNLKGWGNSNAWTSIFGAYSGEDHNAYRIIRNNTNNTTISLWNGAKASGGSTPVNIQLNTVYEFDLNRTHYVFGNASGNLKLNYTGTENTGNLILYGQHKVVFYYFKIYKADILIRDLVPVRVGNVGYMYDRVSHALFGLNTGTGNLGSFILGPDKYDAQIQYLQSTGTQYIDTGYIPNENTQLYIEFSISSYNTNMAQATSPFGVRIAYQQNQYVLFCPVNRTNSVYFCYGNLSPSYTQQINLNQKYVCNINKNIWTLSSNNSTLITNTFATAQSTNLSNLHLWLFKFNNNNIMPGGDDKLKIYKCTIKENDVLIHDLISVRIGNSGYMYDKTSGRLFGNSGTGEFTLGPDVV